MFLLPIMYRYYSAYQLVAICLTIAKSIGVTAVDVIFPQKHFVRIIALMYVDHAYQGVFDFVLIEVISSEVF